MTRLHRLLRLALFPGALTHLVQVLKLFWVGVNGASYLPPTQNSLSTQTTTYSIIKFKIRSQRMSIFTSMSCSLDVVTIGLK